MLPWLNLEQDDSNSGFEVFWMNSIDNIYTFWNNFQNCIRECELVLVDIMLTVVTYSVVFTVVSTLHCMYLQVIAVRVQFSWRILGLNGSSLNGE